jgi:signal transduction histidine kinase/CheY-like chemotaxis protein/HPt (histidine-containing phosphotransfer) domain-containing protein
MTDISSTPGWRWTVRNVSMGLLLLFAIVPAGIVGWNLHESMMQSSKALSQRIMQDTAQRVQREALHQFDLANTVLNGLLETEAAQAQLERGRQMINEPQSFETTAQILVRMYPSTPFVFAGTPQGGFIGVQALPNSSQGYNKVGVQAPGQDRRNYFEALKPGDRSRALPSEASIFDARKRPWYEAAATAGKRIMTSVYVSASSRQLIITAAQPVLDLQDKVMGVFGVDLVLKELNDNIRLIPISRRGVAYIVDEQGLMVASSGDDELFQDDGTALRRLAVNSSASEVIKRSWTGLMSANSASQVRFGGVRFAGRFGEGDDALLVSAQSFGSEYGLNFSLVVAVPELDFSAQANEARDKALWWMALTLILGAAAATFFAWLFSRSIQKLTQAAETIGRGEVPDLVKTRLREVHALSAVLHHSAVGLARQQQELLDVNENLEERVTLRTEQLEESREEALQAAKAKAAFLATMSHEIRTPLNGVVGMTTLMADTPLNEEQLDYLHTMRVSSDQLLSVINDILDFSKIESGKLDLENEPLSIQGTIEEACDMGAPRAREKGLELLVDVGDEVPSWVRGDVTRLRQILLNFLGNAIKFTDKGQIFVTAHLKEDFDAHRVIDGRTQPGALIEFRVKDSGIGIPQDRQDALFQSFTQVDASTTRKYGGTGLGLAICKRLAEMMGGSVGLESEAGQGSTFWFTARMQFTDAPDTSEASILELASLEGKLAVIVDDMPVNIQILDKQLKRWKMKTVAFDNAPDALRWLSTRDADVIISDMHMPQMDGVMLAQSLHKIKPHAQVVLLTSGTLPTSSDASEFAGRLLKPYRQSQLFNILARILYAKGTPQVIEPAKQVITKNQTILVADDNLVNIKVAVSMLTKLGYESVSVMDGRQAVDSVAASLQAGGKRFAAVLMDANMPVLDGYGAAQLIIATHGRDAPPIIALTASVLEEDRQRCINAGMIGFLPKPLRIDELSQGLAQYAYVQKDDSLVTTELIANYSYVAGGEGQKSLNSSESKPIAEPLIDWSRLDQFKEFDDDVRSMTREVMGLFVQDAPDRRKDIVASLATTDSALLSLRAHALKGSASNVGAVALANACSVLEHACKASGWPADAAAQIAKIDVLTDQTLAALKEWKP